MQDRYLAKMTPFFAAIDPLGAHRNGPISRALD
jgi:hypothetical protein